MKENQKKKKNEKKENEKTQKLFEICVPFLKIGTNVLKSVILIRLVIGQSPKNISQLMVDLMHVSNVTNTE